jgi:hypothetical protein
MPALELAGLPTREYAKPCKPPGKNAEHEMRDLGRWGNRGAEHGAENRFHWLALATGPDGKSTGNKESKMTVDISNFIIATPLPISDTNPISLDLIGWRALIECPSVIAMLPDGSLQMTAPTLGASSKSVHRTRCEWKEPGYWLFSSAADHWCRQEMRLTKVNSLQKVVIGQIHVQGSERPPVKVFWNKGKITLGFRSSYLQDDPVNSTVLENVPLGALFKINIHANSTGAVSVSASCNGVKSTSAIMRLDNTWDTKTLAFHGGVYNQIDYSETTDPEDGSICVISDLSITHG